ncbi:MAG: hypothetical protein JNL58_00525 [Planctomyces sp.]|nr:hypothetical protein [Planctomyces sp.]
MNEPEDESTNRAADHKSAATEPSEELIWLAFRYVLNELSQPESEAFEQQLEDDESACLAVARATQLASAMQVSCEEFHRERSWVTNPESKRTQQRDELVEKLRARVQSERERAVSIRRPLRVFATVVAGCVILSAAVATYFQSSSTGRLSLDPSGRTAGTVQEGTLMIADRNHQRAFSPAENAAAENLLGLYGAEYVPGDTGHVTTVTGADELDLSNSDSGIAVPDWLLTAVELDHANGNRSSSDPNDEHFDDEQFDDGADSSPDETSDQSSEKSEVL